MKRVNVFLALVGALLLIASFLPWPAVADQGETTPSSSAATDPAGQGVALFRAKGCIGCHRHAAIDEEGGSVGPDLTHYDADPAFLRRWLADPASVRPNTLMPNLQLAPDEIEALIAFLKSEPGAGK